MDENQDRFRRQFDLPDDRPLLLYVGRVAYEKNIDFLLRMFVRLRARRPDALFVIAGEGPALLHLKKLARELGVDAQVRFIGYLDRSTELPDCYAAVSTAELGTRSILTPDCGAYVVPEEEETFAAAVAEALQLAPESPRRAQLRAHAESWASLAMARRLLAFYERVRTAHAMTAKTPTLRTA